MRISAWLGKMKKCNVLIGLTQQNVIWRCRFFGAKRPWLSQRESQGRCRASAINYNLLSETDKHYFETAVRNGCGFCAFIPAKTVTYVSSLSVTYVSSLTVTYVTSLYKTGSPAVVRWFDAQYAKC